MGLLARCSSGHQWEIAQGSTDPAKKICPVCGSLPTESKWTDQVVTSATNQESSTRIEEDHHLSESDSSGIPYTRNTPARPTDTYEIDPDVTPTEIDTAAKGAPSWQSTVSLPGYEILNLLGRGGMSVVYKARQKGLKRLVAVKMLRPEPFEEPRAQARFHAEAQAVAQLKHPNIVQIFEIGNHDGKQYLSLELVSGGTLARRIRRSGFTPRQAAQILEIVARAVQYAHDQGILHRDLKPGNILLTEDDTPKITDFGLAKRLEEIGKDADGPRLTATGEILGTPSYMAPEQAAALNREISPATDVYALGAVLYEMLTRRPPFEGDTPMQTAMQVLQTDPTPPQQIDPAIPRDLQTICLTCLEKEPARRYRSAETLANELQSFLAGEPIEARPASGWRQIARLVRKRPVLALGIGVGAAAVLGMVLGALWYGPLAMACAAAASLLIAAWWYNARLQKALNHASEQHLKAERNVERMQLLLETTQDLIVAESIEELLYLLSETTTRIAQAERATVFLIDKDKNELWSKLALGENVGEIRVKMGQGVAGIVAQTGETINIADPYADPRFHPEIDKRTGYKTRNLLTFPMRGSDGHMLGVFQVLNKKTGQFDSEDINILKSLAASAASVVEKSQSVDKN